MQPRKYKEFSTSQCLTLGQGEESARYGSADWLALGGEEMGEAGPGW